MIDTFCKETVLYFPTNLRGNYSPEEAWGKLAKGCGDYSRRESGEARQRLRQLGGNFSWRVWRSSRRAAETTPGGSLVWGQVHHIVSQDNCGDDCDNCQRPPTQSFTRPLDGWFPAAPLPTGLGFRV